MVALVYDPDTKSYWIGGGDDWKKKLLDGQGILPKDIKIKIKSRDMDKPRKQRAKKTDAHEILEKATKKRTQKPQKTVEVIPLSPDIRCNRCSVKKIALSIRVC